MTGKWIVDSGFAYAMIVFEDSVCIRTAPIYRKWFLNKTLPECEKIIQRKGWTYKKL